jgi:nucleotide-binding universal stress UspA family protein
VLLATLDVPFTDDAIAFAVDAAVESARSLIVVNVAEILLAPAALAGYGYIEKNELQLALGRVADLAASLAVTVERIRVCSPHPIAALLQVASERGVGLLVFGPDRSQLSRWRYRRAVKAIRERATTLVWTAD